ncbi:hypothetical protein ABPG72_006050 [Tetrahymena utriculariae]
MNKFIALFALVFCTVISINMIYHSNTNKFLLEFEDDEIDFQQEWEKYQKTYRIHFDDSEEEEEKRRFQIFRKNLAYILSKPGLSITEHTHLTKEEFAQMSFGVVEQEPDNFQLLQQVDEPINSIDWVSNKAVSDVKNQGMCQSSWAFAAVAGVESALFLKNGEIPNISEQNLLDCDQSNQDCIGGDREKAIKYIINQGLTSQLTNPYRAYKQKKCKFQVKQPFSISKYTQINNCKDLLAALQNGPVVIAIDGTDLQFYESGILNTNYSSRSVGGLLVEYNHEQGYYKIKTSLGSNFGEQGYVRLSGQVKDGMIQNTAGICDKAFQVFA